MTTGISVVEAAEAAREVDLTTFGRRTGRPSRRTIWITTDPRGRLFIRSGRLDAFQQNWFGSVVEGKPEIVQRHGVVITTALMDRLIRGDESARAFVKASTGLDDDGLSGLISTEDHDTPVGTACTDITHPPFDDAVPGRVTTSFREFCTVDGGRPRKARQRAGCSSRR